MYQISVLPPVCHTVKLSWRDRLLSWPWRPWVTHREEWCEQLPDNEFVRMGYTIYANQYTAKKLMAAAEAVTSDALRRARAGVV